MISRRRPASTSSETEKQLTTRISSELQKQLEKRRKWEKIEDSQATNKTEILTHQSQQQTNAGEYIYKSCWCTFTIMSEQVNNKITAQA